MNQKEFEHKVAQYLKARWAYNDLDNQENRLRDEAQDLFANYAASIEAADDLKAARREADLAIEKVINRQLIVAQKKNDLELSLIQRIPVMDVWINAGEYDVRKVEGRLSEQTIIQWRPAEGVKS